MYIDDVSVISAGLFAFARAELAAPAGERERKEFSIMRIYEPGNGQKGAAVTLHRWEFERLVQYIDSLKGVDAQPLDQLRHSLMHADMVDLRDEVLTTYLSFIELTQLGNLLSHLLNKTMLVHDHDVWKELLSTTRVKANSPRTKVLHSHG